MCQRTHQLARGLIKPQKTHTGINGPWIGPAFHVVADELGLTVCLRKPLVETHAMLAPLPYPDPRATTFLPGHRDSVGQFFHSPLGPRLERGI